MIRRFCLIHKSSAGKKNNDPTAAFLTIFIDGRLKADADNFNKIVVMNGGNHILLGAPF